MILFSGRSKNNVGGELLALRKDKNFSEGLSLVDFKVNILRGDFTLHTPIFQLYIELFNVTLLEFSIVKVEH